MKSAITFFTFFAFFLLFFTFTFAFANNIDDILVMHGIHGDNHPLSSNDERLPSIMNTIVGQLSAYHVFNNEINDMNNNDNDNDNKDKDEKKTNKVETLFLVKSYASPYFSMMVLTNSEYYMVTPEKTYYIAEEEYTDLRKNYKFFYYENMDSFSKLTLQDLEHFIFLTRSEK